MRHTLLTSTRRFPFVSQASTKTLLALADPERHYRDQRDEEDLAGQRLQHREYLRQPDRRREIAEPERRQRDEAEVHELRLRAGLLRENDSRNSSTAR